MAIQHVTVVLDLDLGPSASGKMLRLAQSERGFEQTPATFRGKPITANVFVGVKA